MSTTEELLDRDTFNVQSEHNSGTNQSNIGPLLLNDRSVFYKGLFGMILCILPGAIIGLVLVKISLDQGKAALVEYKASPERFSLSSYKKVKRGRMFAYIGLAMFILEILALVLYTAR
jgi:hypothetical protein